MGVGMGWGWGWGMGDGGWGMEDGGMEGGGGGWGMGDGGGGGGTTPRWPAGPPQRAPQVRGERQRDACSVDSDVGHRGLPGSAQRGTGRISATDAHQVPWERERATLSAHRRCLATV